MCLLPRSGHVLIRRAQFRIANQQASKQAARKIRTRSSSMLTDCLSKSFSAVSLSTCLCSSCMACELTELMEDGAFATLISEDVLVFSTWRHAGSKGQC